MTEQNFEINAKDLQKLQKLLEAEEKRFDAENISDDELLQMEKQLEDRIRQLVPKSASEAETLEGDLQRNWQAIQARQGAIPKENEKGKVLAFASKQYLWAQASGIVAAAALLFFMLRPSEEVGVMGPSGGWAEKGTSTAEVTAGQCEVNTLRQNNLDVEPSEDGLGFWGKQGAEVSLTLDCNVDGYVQALIVGPRSQKLVNQALTHGQKTVLREGDKEFVFALDTKSSWRVFLFISAEPWKDESVFPAKGQSQEGLGILWSDEIKLEARE